MSIWQNIKAEDLDLDGDEINIHYDDDSSGAWYLVVKVKDIKDLLSVRDERSEESADWKEILEEAKRFIADSFIYRPDWTVQDGDRRKPEQTWEEGKNVVISYLPVLINRTIQAERTRIIKALKGLNKPGYCEEWKRIGGCNCGYSGSHDRDYGHNQALNQAIKAVGESAGKEDE